MTTMELIERGIGHNCLSDAYDLGRADAIEEVVDAICCHSAFTNMQKDAIRIYAEQLKEKL